MNANAPRLVAVTVPLPASAEPRALLTPGVVPGAARAYWAAYDETARWAGRGAAHVATAAGPTRLAEVGRILAEARAALADEGAQPADLRWFGGFAFEDETPGGPWSAFGAARFILPALIMARDAEGVRLTACGPAREAAAVAARARAVAERLADARPGGGMPGIDLADAAPLSAGGDADGAERHSGSAAPEAGAPPPSDRGLAARLAGAVAADPALRARLAAGIDAVRAGAAEKVVLGALREVALAAAADPLALLATLRHSAPGCTHFLLAPGAGPALVGATPERLVAVAGDRLRTMALAGTAPRGATPAADEARAAALLASAKDRAEHALVVRALREALAGAAVTAPDAPRTRALATLWHLETPLTARLAARGDVLAAAARLHPTPALAGRPRDAARALIARLEPEGRGWFGGAAGWVDGRGDGDLAVVIRALLVHGARVAAFAGAGLVAASDAADEAGEIALKLRAALAPLEASARRVAAA